MLICYNLSAYLLIIINGNLTFIVTACYRERNSCSKISSAESPTESPTESSAESPTESSAESPAESLNLKMVHVAVKKDNPDMYFMNIK